MANELTLSGLRIQFAKANVPSVDFSPASMSVTVTANVNMDNVQTVGITEEAILLGDVSTGGYCYIENLDTTNFISLRQATGAANFAKIAAGKWNIITISPDATAPFAIADTAACRVRFLRFGL